MSINLNLENEKKFFFFLTWDLVFGEKTKNKKQRSIRHTKKKKRKKNMENETQFIKTREEFIKRFEVEVKPQEEVKDRETQSTIIVLLGVNLIDTAQVCFLLPQDLVWIVWEYYDMKYYIICHLCGNLTFPLTLPMDCKHTSIRKCETCQSFAISRLQYFKFNVGDPAGIITQLIEEYWICETTSCKENGLGDGNVVNQCFSCSQKIFALFRLKGMMQLIESLENQNPLRTDWAEESFNEESQLVNQNMSKFHQFLTLSILEEKRKIKEEEKEKFGIPIITANTLRFVPCHKCRRLFHFSRMIMNESYFGCPVCCTLD